ncbi:MAG: YceI family protein [Actinomycetota bacterium]
MTTTTLPIATGTWTIDPAHSSVEFVVRHMGLSKVRGRFGAFVATLQVDEDLTRSALSAEVDLASVSTGNDDRDQHLRSTDFFGTDANPKMSFTSTRIEGDGEEYVAVGDLTINGVTREVALDVEFNGTETFPFDQSVHAGFSATGAISRRDFGVEFEVPLGADKVMIGDKISIELEAQFAPAS